MTRPFDLSRQQAEFIVDACEANGALEWMGLAAAIREHWGMGPYPAGSVRQPAQQTCVHPWEKVGINADGNPFCVECLTNLVKDPPWRASSNQSGAP